MSDLNRKCISGCKNTDNLKNIYMSSDETDKLFHMLIGIEIHSDSYLCNCCNQKLMEFYQFKQSCLDFQRQLDADNMKVDNVFVDYIYEENMKIEGNIADYITTQIKVEQEEDFLIDTYEQEDNKLSSESDQDQETATTSNKQTICSYCNNSYSNKVNLTRHLRKAHSHELKDEDKGVLVFKKRKPRNSFGLVEEANRSIEVEKDSKKSIEQDSKKRKISSDSESDSESFRNIEEVEIETILASAPQHKCNYCGNLYMKKASLVKHLRKVHFQELKGKDKKVLEIRRREIKTIRLTKNPEKDIYSKVHNKMCMYCLDEFPSTAALSAHKEIHSSEERPYRCFQEGCESRFSNRIAVRAHYITHTNQKKFQCKFCQKKFNIKQNCRVHVRSVHKLKHDKESVENGIKILLSSECEDESETEKTDPKNTTEEAIKRIRLENDLYKQFDLDTTCECCFIPFENSEYLQEHFESHKDEEKPYKCPFENCTSAFAKKGYLRHHYYNHAVTDEEYKCKKCEKVFRNPLLHREHEKNHERPNSFLCPICGDNFRAASCLKGHLRQHSGETPFFCSFCDRKFVNKNSKVIHERAKHTFERPYICSTCGKSFLSSNALTLHTRYHTGERPYKCRICNKSAHVDNKHLNRHMREIHGIITETKAQHKTKNHLINENSTL